VYQRGLNVLLGHACAPELPPSRPPPPLLLVPRRPRRADAYTHQHKQAMYALTSLSLFVSCMHVRRDDGAQVTHTRAQHDGVRSRVAALLARRCAAPLSVSPPRIRAVASRVASPTALRQAEQRRRWRRPQRVASRRGQAGGGGDGSSRPRRAARGHALTYCWTIGRRHDQSTLDDRRVESEVLYILRDTLIAKAKTASLSSIPWRNSASSLSSAETRSCPFSATAIAKQGFVSRVRVFVTFSLAFVNIIDNIINVIKHEASILKTEIELNRDFSSLNPKDSVYILQILFVFARLRHVLITRIITDSFSLAVHCVFTSARGPTRYEKHIDICFRCTCLVKLTE